MKICICFNNEFYELDMCVGLRGRCVRRGENKSLLLFFKQKRNVTNFSPLERVRVTRANNQLLFDLDSGVVGTVTIKICIRMHCIWNLMIN